jgi:hypothetical protein
MRREKKNMKTNTKLWENLINWYPEQMGIISKKEVDFVKKSLELEGRDITSLRNMRDTVVLLWIIEDSNTESFEVRTKKTDRMSAVTAVIDSMIIKLGGEV